jgi:hypothetical protein
MDNPYRNALQKVIEGINSFPESLMKEDLRAAVIKIIRNNTKEEGDGNETWKTQTKN